MIPKQYRIHVVLMIAAAVMIVFPLLSEKPEEAKAEPALAAAEQFLGLVDQGQYAESWQVAAAMLQEKVTEPEWVAHLTKARSMAGPLVERQQEDITYATMAQDSPDGEYIVLKYESSFQNAAELEETVTVMLDKEGRWRVAGYFMQ